MTADPSAAQAKRDRIHEGLLGWSDTRIGEMFGRNRSTVNTWLNRNGWQDVERGQPPVEPAPTCP